jgi:general secretion pathway protein I
MVRRRLKSARSGGFTLLEVIIAFVIMALVVGATFDTFSTGLRSALLTGDYAGAVVRAESRLALLAFSEPLEAGVKSGKFDDVYVWRTEVRPVPADKETDTPPPPFSLYDVVVTVAWGSGAHARKITLKSQRLGKGPDA